MRRSMLDYRRNWYKLAAYACLSVWAVVLCGFLLAFKLS